MHPDIAKQLYEHEALARSGVGASNMHETIQRAFANGVIDHDENIRLGEANTRANIET